METTEPDTGSPRVLPAPVIRLLEREPLVWLGTTRDDGRAHMLPLWFAWNGEAITLFSKPGALKVRNIRRDPRVVLALGRLDETTDVALLEGLASLPAARSVSLPEAQGLGRYASSMARLGLSLERFLATYSQPIRITPSRALDWGQPGWAPAEHPLEGALEPVGP